MKRIKIFGIAALLLALLFSFASCNLEDIIGGKGSLEESRKEEEKESVTESLTEFESTPETLGGYEGDLLNVPAFAGVPYIVINENTPYFTEEEITVESYEYYSELDALGRCGVTVSCIGKDMMPTDERESISSVKPTGWVNNKYDTSLVEGGYIYNRCHLIGFQLTGENARKENLITGTRYMNVTGMLPFENMVADYLHEYEENHVMYRVTPIFEGSNLVANGVLMEAYSVEDEGEEICFCVYVYNVQPGITIDYRTGNNVLDSKFDGFDTLPPEDVETDEEGRIMMDYIINTSSKKFHDVDCGNADDISEHNRREYHGAREDLIEEGYNPCGACKP